MLPTADDVAIALIASCKETGEDPIQAAARSADQTFRGRHYALHALVHVFPKANRFSLCRMVGCPGKPGPFWNASWNQIAKPRFPGSLTHMANWWDDAVYDRVIRAIEADRTRRAVAPKYPKPEVEPPPYRPPPGTYERELGRPRAPAKLGTLESTGYRPPANAIEEMLAEDDDEKPIFDRGRIGGKKPRQDTFILSRQSAYDTLKEAVANTVKLQTGE